MALLSTFIASQPNRAVFAVFEELKDLLAEYDLKSVSDTSGISLSTLYLWVDGKVRFPHLRTIVRVAEALGYEVVLQMSNEISGLDTLRSRHLKVIK